MDNKLQYVKTIDTQNKTIVYIDFDAYPMIAQHPDNLNSLLRICNCDEIRDIKIFLSSRYIKGDLK
jgi:hypothetical protein